jgi:O-antigen ligase
MSVAATQTLPRQRPMRGERTVGTGTLWWLIGIAGIVAGLVAATYANRELTMLGMLVAVAVLSAVVVKPQTGILLLMANFVVASYPSPLRGEGLLTINNMLGILLSVLLVARLAQQSDLSFLRIRQLHVFVAIGIVFTLSTIAASYEFPDLRQEQGRLLRDLDQTSSMARDLVTRFAFFVLAVNFLNDRRDLKRAIAVTLICLVMVVPSALFGYATGRAQAGYRAAAEFSAATNPNRLAFFCLMQIAFWWYFIRGRATVDRVALGLVVIASLMYTVLLTASRSGILGFGVLLALLTQSRGGMRGGRLRVLAVALVAVCFLVTVVPQENLARLQDLNPFVTKSEGGIASFSTERRVETVEQGWRMFNDHPLFGVGLGNFRPVAKQVYQDKFYRPPHNSYVWSLSEGGIFCLLLYLLLFALTWRDIRWLQASPAVPQDLRWITAALEPAFLLMLFYSAFADIWLSPITYILITLVVVFKRYVSRRRVVIV